MENDWYVSFEQLSPRTTGSVSFYVEYLRKTLFLRILNSSLTMYFCISIYIVAVFTKHEYSFFSYAVDDVFSHAGKILEKASVTFTSLPYPDF